MKYYYMDGVNKFGPLSIEQMLINDVNVDTMVWCDGMSEWQRAGDVETLAEALKSVPPPIPKAQPEPQPQVETPPPPPPARPKTWFLESILVTIFCCLPFGIVGIVHAINVESRYNAKDYDGAIQASNDAGKWCKIGFWITAVGVALYILAIVIFGFGSMAMLTHRSIF
ncbi:MAG: CD225/dispanin family protein [Rikenellaceae bacterium]